MNLKPIRFRFGFFKVTIGVNWQKERLSEFIDSVVDWQDVEQHIEQIGFGEHDAQKVIRTVRNYLTGLVKAQ